MIKIISIAIVFLILINISLLSTIIYSGESDKILLHYVFTASSYSLDIIFSIDVVVDTTAMNITISKTITIESIDLRLAIPREYAKEVLQNTLSKIIEPWVGKVRNNLYIDINGMRDKIVSSIYISISKYIVKAYVLSIDSMVEYRDANKGLLLGGEYEQAAVISYHMGGKLDLGVFVIKYQLASVSPEEYINTLDIVEPIIGVRIALISIPILIALALFIITIMKWKYYVIL